ncbi:hypothetical protein [Kitasatospora sp. LaBMicrA B282]|uniref:hypothetical protein n=1 Tax=Kitasatospora sp. LaBMicrA B282 TaxID=3420949 RepID=UPI003D125377
MRERKTTGVGVFGPPPVRRAATATVVRDRHWPAAARRAAGCALAFAALAVLVDWGTGGLTLLRAALWVGLAWCIFAVLVPPRVSAGPGWLEVRELLRARRVRTDALVVLRQNGSIAVHLTLRDAHGSWVELDPGVLRENPLLWHQLDTAARQAESAGTLQEGAEVLRGLADAVLGEEVRGVLRRSGLG